MGQGQREIWGGRCGGWRKGQLAGRDAAELSFVGLILGYLMPSFSCPCPMCEHGVFRTGFLEEVTSELER